MNKRHTTRRHNKTKAPIFIAVGKNPIVYMHSVLDSEHSDGEVGRYDVNSGRDGMTLK